MPQKETWMKRAAGVLLPVSSLPGKDGIGSLGKAAYQWVDFLKAAKQKYWQVLPLGPTGYGNSPYQSVSAFAGNPYFVDPGLLCRDGLLEKEEIRAARGDAPANQVDYPALERNREALLRKAYARFTDWEGLEKFRRVQRDWVEDYALFVAVKARMGGKPWTQWEEGIRLRRPEAMEAWREECRQDMGFHVFVQYLFYTQWKALKRYANRKGVKIIGDAPIYVAMDSADVWASPELFQLGEQYLPTEVAGCPPDAFSEDGQLWGNPLYRWDVMEQDGFRWWMRRLKANLTLVDVLRIDHFRGLESYYAIPYGEETARNGRWKKGPGRAFIKAVKAAFPGAPIIAEDLGYLTPAVHRLLRTSGFPGMKVLQFAFDGTGESDYMPHRYAPNCVVYTGTHDNDTTAGWVRAADPKTVEKAMAYAGVQHSKQATEGLVRLALSSVSDLAVIPIQDYLELGSEARINTPSTLSEANWRWRLRKKQLTPELAVRMAAWAALYGRDRKDPPKAKKRGRKPS